MIAKDFIIAKDFRSYSANFLRQDKIIRDHGNLPRRTMSLIARKAPAPRANHRLKASKVIKETERSARYLRIKCFMAEAARP
jgi:hypothetical protein